MESVRLDTPQGAPGMGKLSDHSSKVESMRERDNGKNPTNVSYACVCLLQFKVFFPF